MILYTATTQTEFNSITLNVGDVFAIEFNEGYELDRHAFTAYFLTPEGEFQWMGFVHEDTFASIGMYDENNQPDSYWSSMISPNSIYFAGVLAPVNIADLNGAQASAVIGRYEPVLKSELVKYLPLRKKQFMKTSVVLKDISNRPRIYGRFTRLGFDLKPYAVQLVKEHNYAEALRREKVEAGRNTLGNMFPELMALK